MVDCPTVKYDAWRDGILTKFGSGEVCERIGLPPDSADYVCWGGGGSLGRALHLWCEDIINLYGQLGVANCSASVLEFFLTPAAGKCLSDVFSAAQQLAGCIKCGSCFDCSNWCNTDHTLYLSATGIKAANGTNCPQLNLPEFFAMTRVSQCRWLKSVSGSGFSSFGEVECISCDGIGYNWRVRMKYAETLNPAANNCFEVELPVDSITCGSGYPIGTGNFSNGVQLPCTESSGDHEEGTWVLSASAP